MDGHAKRFKSYKTLRCEHLRTAYLLSTNQMIGSTFARVFAVTLMLTNDIHAAAVDGNPLMYWGEQIEQNMVFW
jgi:hypothetical protein